MITTPTLFIKRSDTQRGAKHVCFPLKRRQWFVQGKDLVRFKSPLSTVKLVTLYFNSYERDFMSNFQQSKRFDLIDKFNETSPLIVCRDSFSPWTWAQLQTARSTAFFNGCPHIFLIYYYITIYVCVPHFCYLSALVDCWSSVSIRRSIYKFLNVRPFDYTAVAVSGKVERS